ncbi:glomulin isoform X1 [Macrosteles quadrilineatus]|uniref:glomulin isoform X1 n=1 Tax=Macrosteles quadrilineatus TaxID=74068 RepID=UPI0023E25CDB|nr:glomulin isoform X1 [Macrosteles quadrilineatus]
MEIQVDMMEHLGDLLSSGDVNSIKEMIAEDSFTSFLQEKSSDLIPVLCCYLNEETMLNDQRLFRYVKKIITMCAEIGNSKECFMEFLAQMETLDELKFQNLLQPVQTTILRIPERKAPLMHCVYSVVYSFINTLPVPTDYNLEKEAKAVLECDENVRRIRENYHLIFRFYEPFVAELEGKCNDSIRILNLRSALVQALLHLLGHPLAFSDMEQNEKGPTSLGLLACKIVQAVHKLQSDPVQLLFLVENKELISVEEEKLSMTDFSSNEFKHSDLSVAVFFYLFVCESDKVLIPYTYSRLFIFSNCFTLASILLQFKETLVLRKGLLLAKAAITMVEEGTLPFSHLAFGVHKEVIDHLSTIAVYHNLEENRKLAVELIRKHFSLFEPKAKFYILVRNDSSTKHPQLFGFFASILTSLVRESFSRAELKPYFFGKRLSDLLNIYCSLKNGAETDLLENKDQIIAALNLIIFLSRRDRSNITNVWSYVSVLQENFLKPLREAIDLSRAHFKEEMKTLDDPEKNKTSEELEVTVGNELLGKMSVQEKKEVINSGLTVFDLIEHVLSRANECVEDKPEL